LKRSFFSDELSVFLRKSSNEILGEITNNNIFNLKDTQKRAWIQQILILKDQLSSFNEGRIIFEYVIPRIGRRIDNVFIHKGIIFLFEFKAGENEHKKHAIDQVMDYALDLKNFHQKSIDKIIAPIEVSTKAQNIINKLDKYGDNIFKPLLCNEYDLGKVIKDVAGKFGREQINTTLWENSIYMPTPTIIEAAQALYKGHNVKEISRSDSGATNLNETTSRINKIIEKAKNDKIKAICFITGVPGAGKTLAGLNIANERHKFDENEHAVFLSGNGPLVDVLQEALARNQKKESNISKKDAIRKAKSFIQIIHHFRDEALISEKPPTEKVVIFDEAQRAWTREQTTSFMQRKKAIPDFDMSEPEFLISYMDRHVDWAVIICLIGGGQEINTGEAGLKEWFSAIKEYHNDWRVFVSDRITYNEYTRGEKPYELFKEMNVSFIKELHLAVSLRSFRAEKVSEFVKAVLDEKKDEAKKIYSGINRKFKIKISRNLDKAKDWIRSEARGTERYGLIASSKAIRLKNNGIWVKNKIDAKMWFLNNRLDVRSSFYLEDTATEFDIQGLELDWALVAWGGDYRFSNRHFKYKSFKGSKWQNIRNETDKIYLKNAYRVLLTRARQGMVIYIPKGNETDETALPEFYNGTYNYLKEIGIEEL